MASFDTWSPENLVKFAHDAAADRNRLLAENIALANSEAVALQHLRALMTEFEIVCDMFCKKPERSDAYRAAVELLR